MAQYHRTSDEIEAGGVPGDVCEFDAALADLIVSPDEPGDSTMWKNTKYLALELCLLIRPRIQGVDTELSQKQNEA